VPLNRLVGGALARCPSCFLSAVPWHPAVRAEALAGYAAGLRAEVEGLVDGTSNNKLSHLRRFRRFCATFSVTAELALPHTGPMSPVLVVLFLTELASGKGSSGKPVAGGTFEHYLSTLNTWHTARGLPPVTAWREVASKLAGWRRELGARGANIVAPKLPFTIHMLKLALSDLATRAGAEAPGSVACFRYRRDALLLAFGFFGLLRKSEQAAARVGHLSLASHYCVLHIPKSKSDQLAKGHHQYFSYITGSGIDLGAILRAYLDELRARGLDSASAPLFPHVTRDAVVAGLSMPGKGEPITNIVRDALRRISALAAASGLLIVLDPSLWASHSLRRGGLNHAMNCNISREARQVLGRWHGEDSQDDYIFWDVARRLAFTVAM
jgi:hypothetical protein